MKGLEIPNSGDEIANLDQRIRHQITEHPDQRGLLYYCFPVVIICPLC